MLVPARGIYGIVELVAENKILSETLVEFVLVDNFDLIEVACFTEQFEQTRLTAQWCSQMV